MNGRLKIILGFIIAFLILSPIINITPIAEKNDYTGHWAEMEINYLIKKGVISGDQRGIRPDDSISRAEFTKILNKNFGFQTLSDSRFYDVTEDKWYFKDLHIARAAGYLTGDESGNANPEAGLTRGEASVIYARLLSLPANEEFASVFNDQAGIPSWAKGAIGALANLKIISGYEDGTFIPYGQMTRAEAFYTLTKIEKYSSWQAENTETSTKSPAFSSGGGSGGGGRPSSSSNEKKADTPDIQSVNIESFDLVIAAVANAASYDLTIARTTQGKNTEVKFSSTETVLNIKTIIENLMKEEKQTTEIFTIQVRAIGKTGYGSSSYSTPQKFTVNNATVQLPTDIRVAQNLENPDQEQISIVWSSVEHALKYEISMDFGNGYIPLTVVGNKAMIPEDKIKTLNEKHNMKFQVYSDDSNILDSKVMETSLSMPLFGGEESQYELIYNERHFQNIARYPKGSYLVKKDITLNEFEQIEKFEGKLIGDIEGNPAKIIYHHTATVFDSENQSNSGLFKEISAGMITKIGISGTLTAGGNSGALASLVSEGTVISQCYSDMNINYIGGKYCGGLIGRFQKSSIEKSYNQGDITVQSATYVGGLIGYQSSGDVTNCYNIGNITSNSSLIGGLIGISYGNINGAYNAGTIEGNRNVAGIVGASLGDTNTTFSNLFNTGTIKGALVAGIISNFNSGKGLKQLDEAYNIGAVISNSSSGGSSPIYNTITAYAETASTKSGCKLGSNVFYLSEQIYSVPNSDAVLKTSEELKLSSFPSGKLMVKPTSFYPYPQLLALPYRVKLTKLDAPTISSVNYDGETITLTVTGNAKTASYLAEVYGLDGQLIQTYQTSQGGSEQSIDISSEINEFGFYQIKVKAIGDGNEYESSDYTTYSYQHKPFTLPAPKLSSDITWKMEDDMESYHISWSAVNSPTLKGYQIRIYSADTNELIADKGMITETEFSLKEESKINFGSSYMISVSAVSTVEGGESDSSSVMINTKYGGGDGSGENPYLIFCGRHFDEIRSNPSKIFALKDSIELSDSYVPFAFSGKLLGDQDTVLRIINVNITSTASSTGLFSELSGAPVIKNIHLKGKVSGASYVGGFAGVMKNLTAGGTIENCINEASVTATGSYVGGIVGDEYVAQDVFAFYKVKNYGSITALSGSYIGGIAGRTRNNIINAANTGTIQGKNGFVGGISGQQYQGKIEYSYNIGAITTNSGYAGGITAYMYLSKEISNSFNAGSVTNNTRELVGGIVSYVNQNNAAISNCYHVGSLNSSEGNVSGKARSIYGGNGSSVTVKLSNCYYLSEDLFDDSKENSTPMIQEEMRKLENFKGFSTDIWEINEAEVYTYPTLILNGMVNL